MTFQITAAKSSRVTKSRSTIRRSSSGSPFGGPARKPTKPSPAKRKASSADEEAEDESARLEDLGLVTALATDMKLRDVPQQLEYSRNHMFEPLPEAGGFNSTRISEILNFRKNLPPVVTVAHIHALSRSPTTTEREISELLAKGVIRKIIIPGRGLGRNSIGECLVLTDAWIEYVEQCSSISDETRRKYCDALRNNSAQSSVATNAFTSEEVTLLIRAGLLTASSAVPRSASGSIQLDPSSVGTLASLSTAGSRAAAGSMEAVGGAGAFMDAGGGGGALVGYSLASAKFGPQLDFAMPSMGPYLRLLESARSHLVDLLSRSAYKEAPKDLLRERWNGAITNKAQLGRAKGFEAVVLPAKTKRWKQFYGLNFQWVLEECLGTGLIEVFETGSVGQGVRLT